MKAGYVLPKSARAQMLSEALLRMQRARLKSMDRQIPKFAQKAARGRAADYEACAREFAAHLIGAGL